MDNINIPHCPFCGGDAAIQIDATTYHINYVYCECKTCGSRGKAVAFGFVWKNFEMAKKEAIELWSMRKDCASEKLEQIRKVAETYLNNGIDTNECMEIMKRGSTECLNLSCEECFAGRTKEILKEG